MVTTLEPNLSAPRDCVLCSPAVGGVVLTAYDLTGRVRFEVHTSEADATPDLFARILATTRALPPTLTLVLQPPLPRLTIERGGLG